MVGTNPGLARRTAQDAAAAARAGGDGRTAALALRAHGRAALELGRLDEATRVLRESVREADRAGEPEAAAEARVSLAYALSERGRTADALRQLDRAADVLRGQRAAGVLMQRGVVLWRCGRTDEALEAYRRALPVLRRGPDRLVEARLYNNRSLVYIDRGELAAAEADLLRFAELCRAEGQHVLAADAETNLGFVTFRRGDVPAALGFLDSAEATYRVHGVPPRELLLTRGELLLSVGAFDEARQTAERAIEQFTAAGWRSLLAEAQLLLSQAQLAGDDLDAAQGAAEHGRHALRPAAAARLGHGGAVHGAAGGRAGRRAHPAAAPAGAAGGRPAGRDGLAGAGAGRPAHRREGGAGAGRPRHRTAGDAAGGHRPHPGQHRAADPGLVRGGDGPAGHRPGGRGRAGAAGRVPGDGAAAGHARRHRAAGARGQPRPRRRHPRHPAGHPQRVAAQGAGLDRALAGRHAAAAAGAAAGGRGAGRRAGRAAPGLRGHRGRAAVRPAGGAADVPAADAGGAGTPADPAGGRPAVRPGPGAADRASGSARRSATRCWSS